MTTRPSRREFLKMTAASRRDGRGSQPVLSAQAPAPAQDVAAGRPHPARDHRRRHPGPAATRARRCACRASSWSRSPTSTTAGSRSRRRLWGDQLFTTRDYREVLARPDVDAVIIATPDHWHAQMAIDAMKAGKDVYVEKPMVQELDEGPAVIEAARQTNRILQVGSQRVSSIVYAKARELFKAGAIGELNLVEAWMNRNSSIGAWQYSIPPDASPATIDWDRFLGNAPKRPFEPMRLFRWRNYRDYGTGIPGDLFVHLFTGIHFVLDSLGTDARDGDRRSPLLERRPRRAGCHARALRLSEDRGASGVHAVAQGELRRRRRRRSGVPLHRSRRHAHDRRARGHAVAPAAPRTIPATPADTFAKAMQEAYMKEHRAKYPEQTELRPTSEEVYAAPAGYSDSLRSLPQLLRRRPHPPSGRRGCRVRLSRGRAGAAHQRQLLRRTSRSAGIPRR